MSPPLHPSCGETPISAASSVSPAVWPSVGIVLLNWNGWQDTLECLRSLRRMDYRACRILIVDNGSTDDSVTQLKKACPELNIIETHRNLGFAAGNNVGIRAEQ